MCVTHLVIFLAKKYKADIAPKIESVDVRRASIAHLCTDSPDLNTGWYETCLHTLFNTGWYTLLNHNPSKTDECPPNIFKMKVNGLAVTFCKRPLDGLWLRRAGISALTLADMRSLIRADMRPLTRTDIRQRHVGMHSLSHRLACTLFILTHKQERVS